MSCLPQVTTVYTFKEDNVYGEGEEIALHVVYTHAMDVLGTPTIPLNSGGEALFNLGGRRQVPNEHVVSSGMQNL